MQEYNVVLTWEAIYDIVDITDYIEVLFGRQRADCFQNDIKQQAKDLGYMADALPKTQIIYRGYFIHKKLFPPSIIFYIVMDNVREVHVLRVLREEQDWERMLLQHQDYTYPQ